MSIKDILGTNSAKKALHTALSLKSVKQVLPKILIAKFHFFDSILSRVYN